MSHETNTIWIEAQEELKAETLEEAVLDEAIESFYKDSQVNISEESIQDIPEGNLEPTKLEQAIIEEVEEEDVKHLAIEAGAFPDENI